MAEKIYRERAHPLTVVKFIRKALLLLLLPVAREILDYISFGTHPSLVVWDTVLAAVIAIYGVMRWRRFVVTVSGGILTVTSGLIFTATTQIKLKNIACVYVEESPFLAVFGAVKVIIDTDARKINNADLSFYLSKKKAEMLCSFVKAERPKKQVCRCPMRQVLILSLSNASALSGLLVAATLINNVGKVVGNEFENRLVETLGSVTAFASQVIPPTALAAAVILVAGFGISFLIAILKHAGFTLSVSEDAMLVTQGLIGRKRSLIGRRAVGAVTIETSPIMRLFGRCSVILHAAGYGAPRAESAAVIPVEKTADAEVSLKKCGLVFCKNEPLTLNVPRRAISRALFIPCVYMAVIIAVAALSLIIFRKLIQFTIILALFLGTADAYWLFIRVRHVLKGGASLDGGIRLCGYRFFTETDSRFKAGHTDCITLTQGPFDRRRNLCTLKVTLRSKNRYTSRVKNLDMAQAEDEVARVFGV